MGWVTQLVGLLINFGGLGTYIFVGPLLYSPSDRVCFPPLDEGAGMGSVYSRDPCCRDSWVWFV